MDIYHRVCVRLRCSVFWYLGDRRFLESWGIVVVVRGWEWDVDGWDLGFGGFDFLNGWLEGLIYF